MTAKIDSVLNCVIGEFLKLNKDWTENQKVDIREQIWKEWRGFKDEHTANAIPEDLMIQFMERRVAYETQTFDRETQNLLRAFNEASKIITRGPKKKIFMRAKALIATRPNESGASVASAIAATEKFLMTFFEAKHIREVTLSSWRPMRIYRGGEGIYRNPKAGSEVTAALHGEAGGSEAARAVARDLQKAHAYYFELVKANGGDVPATKKPFISNPLWSASKLIKMGYEVWEREAMPRFNWKEMLDKETGEMLNLAGRQRVLREIFDSVTSDGRNKQTLIKSGKMRSFRSSAEVAIGDQISRQRVVHLIDSQAWMEMNDLAGSLDSLSTHLAGLKSIASNMVMVDRFGPDATQTVKFINDAVGHYVDGMKHGTPAERAAHEKLGAQVASFKEDADSLLDYVLHGAHVTHPRVAGALSETRKGLMGLLLGSAWISALFGDGASSMISARFRGMPVARQLRHYGLMMKGEGQEGRLQIEGMLEMVAFQSASAARYNVSDANIPHGVFGRVSTKSMQASALSSHTVQATSASTLTALNYFGEHAHLRFDELPEKPRNWFKSAGVTETDWDLVRPYTVKSDKLVEGAIYLDPNRAARESTDKRVFGAAMRITAGFHEEATQFAVPTGNTRMDHFMLGGKGRAAGTAMGEISRFIYMLKRFPLMQAAASLARVGDDQLQGWGAKTNYLLAVAGSMTVAGAMSTIVYDLVNGKDIPDMTDDQFWWRAFIRGGGGGILLDIIYQGTDPNDPFRRNLPNFFLGPGFSLLTDSFNLSVGNFAEVLTGQDTNFAHEMVRYAERYGTFGASSNWYTRLLVRRLISESVLKFVDSYEAAEKFDRQINNSFNRTGQEFWWEPGSTTPNRAPGTTNRTE